MGRDWEERTESGLWLADRPGGAYDSTHDESREIWLFGFLP